MKRTTAKLRCSCEHEYQDKQYGRGVRLHNAKTAVVHGNLKIKGFRCTVCGDEKRSK